MSRFITVVEVGPRDGLQNESVLLEPAEKLDFIARLEACGVPVGPVNTLEDVFNDPFVEARQTVHRFVREDGVEIPSVAYPGKLTATPADYRYQPPKVGEQTRELLGEWLGLGDAELKGVVERIARQHPAVFGGAVRHIGDQRAGGHLVAIGLQQTFGHHLTNHLLGNTTAG